MNEHYHGKCKLLNEKFISDNKKSRHFFRVKHCDVHGKTCCGCGWEFGHHFDERDKIEVNNEVGCAKLLAEVVFQTFSPQSGESGKNKEERIEKKKGVNKTFARNSILLDDFCSIYGFDINKVRGAIIKANK